MCLEEVIIIQAEINIVVALRKFLEGQSKKLSTNGMFCRLKRMKTVPLEVLINVLLFFCF